MNRGEIRSLVRIYIDELEEKRWKDTSLNLLINTVHNSVASLFLSLDESLYSQDDEFAVSTDSELYDLPVDFLRVKSIHTDDDDPVVRTPISRKKKYEDADSIRVYYFQGNQIGFLKIKSEQTLPFMYIRAPQPMLTDDAIPDVPVFLGHDLIAVEVAIHALDLDEEMDTYLTRKKKELVEQIKSIHYRRNTDFAEQTEDDEDLEL